MTMMQRSQSPLAASAPAGWLAEVRAYAARRGEAEAAFRIAPLAGAVGDAAHLARLESRLARLREREAVRGASTEKLETTVRPLRTEDSGGELCVLLELRQSRTVRQHGTACAEEKREWERLWLGPDGTICRIEPLIPERSPRYQPQAGSAGAAHAAAYLSQSAPKSGSVPYLNTDVLLYPPQTRKTVEYRRDLAAVYADRWWNEANPAYEEFDVNCTNYVSQCLFAGHAPMHYTGRRDAGWWYRGRDGGRELWSYNWAVANALQRYLAAHGGRGLRATEVSSAAELSLGDVICYDWYGDGHGHHNTIVTAFDGAGMPLVNANTVPSRHRYWDYRDSYAWTERTRYRFFHIADAMEG